MSDASDVVATILTGQRPSLLSRTLSSFHSSYPWFFESATIVVLHNGSDSSTGEVLDQYRSVVDEVDTTPDVIGIGPAISRLSVAASESGMPYWFHLEDDWVVSVLDEEWLDKSRQLLNSDVAQVRLRHSSERVMARHMYTGKELHWEERDGYRYCSDAHLTFNPFLIRSRDIGGGWPCAGERDAQKKWHRAGHSGVAQLLPGIFSHIGDEDSLRIKTGTIL